MTEGQGLRAKIKRRFSMKDKNVDPDDFSDADEETSSHLQKEIERAEKEGHDQGRPGGLLNRLISYGNDKTEKQLREEAQRSGAAATAN